MELLILKSAAAYIRVKEDQFLRVGLDKASVFPMDQLDLVKIHEAHLKTQGFESVKIKRLILSEEDI